LLSQSMSVLSSPSYVVQIHFARESFSAFGIQWCSIFSCGTIFFWAKLPKAEHRIIIRSAVLLIVEIQEQYTNVAHGVLVIVDFGLNSVLYSLLTCLALKKSKTSLLLAFEMESSVCLIMTDEALNFVT
jgi:hypothetical protein